jgi:hypothetical protein
LTQAPANPKIYHIVHVDNLASIVSTGRLLPDSVMSRRQGGTVIGMGAIKQRRLALPVGCHAKTCVGDFVPFYFCSRSVMLFVIHCANHPELAYRGGQQPIVHLEADLHEAIDWADGLGFRWAVALSNAGARYAQFRTGLDTLNEVDWPAVAARDFRDSDVQEGKQAEFLVEREFPWQLFERIGVYSLDYAHRVSEAMRNAAHRPTIDVRRDWYY